MAEKSAILCFLVRYAFLEFHHFDKTEHLVRSLVGITFIVIRHFVVGSEIFTPKLINLKSTLVNVKVNVTLFKIWCTSLPNYCFGVQSLNCKPRAISDPLSMLLGRNEKDLKLIVMRFFVDLQNNTSNASAIQNNTIGFAVG